MPRSPSQPNGEDGNDKDTPSPRIDKHLFDSRHILLTGEINQEIAREVCARLFAMAHVSDDPITMIVSSPGGHVESGDMIHDTVKFIRPEVRMLGTGWVASAGALIFVAAKPANRFSLPNTRFLLHQPSGGAGGSASDIKIQAMEIIKMRERLNKIFADATGQTLEKIQADTERDHWLSAEEAIDYGLVGKVINTADELG
ncbi:MAG: ATP-dependent Clp protease proteolytic subunit [Pseudomonadota bacterium]